MLDIVLLGVVTGLICFPFFEPLSHIGPWGKALGGLIAVLYFGLMDGPAGGGQSVGKRLMKIRVVSAQGQVLPSSASFLRAAIFNAPYFLYGVELPLSRTPEALHWTLGALIVGVSATTAYLLLFNKPTQQGLHDLLTGSYVVDAVELDAIQPEPFWLGHWAILGALFLVYGLGGALLGRWLWVRGPMPALLADAALVEALPRVEGAAVIAQTNIAQTESGAATRRTLIVRLHWTGAESEQEDLADRAAALILQNDPAARKYDALRVVVMRGYDLGLTSSWRAQSFEHSPNEWD